MKILERYPEESEREAKLKKNPPIEEWARGMGKKNPPTEELPRDGRDRVKPSRKWIEGTVTRQLDVMAEQTRHLNIRLAELTAEVLAAWPEDLVDEWMYLQVNTHYYGHFTVGLRKAPRSEDILFEACSEPHEGWWPLDRPPFVLVQILQKVLVVTETTEGHWEPWSNPHLDRPVSDLDLSPRVYAIVRGNRSYLVGGPPERTIGDLVRMTDSQVLDMNGIGHASLREIKSALNDLDLCLGMYVEEQGPIEEVE